MLKNIIARRVFLKLAALFALFIGRPSIGLSKISDKFFSQEHANTYDKVRPNIGVDADGVSRVYMSKGHQPEKNIFNVIELMGGIEKFIDKNDIVILKPNAQWWNQGMTNTDSMKALIEIIVGIPGFKGEIIIAENHQYANPDSRGWSTDKPNGKYNLNDLVKFFQKKGHDNVTKYHWQCAGYNPYPKQGDASSASKIVKGPSDGDGYVWSTKYVYNSPLGRKCLMTYPVFTSSYSGVTVDLRNGAWQDGKYTGQPLKLINFSALNHHSAYSGVTASVKNYMGMVDMTCGYQGLEPKGYWNTHYIGLRDISIPFKKYLPWRFKKELNSLYSYKYVHHSAGALGYFMRNVRIADLNIITAHWVGYGSRTDPTLSGYPKAIMISKDPVALDFVAGMKIIYPLTREKAPNNKWLIKLHDPMDKDGPYYKFLKACNEEGIGTLDLKKIMVVE